jgi:hypothetical protein
VFQEERATIHLQWYIILLAKEFSQSFVFHHANIEETPLVGQKYPIRIVQMKLVDIINNISPQKFEVSITARGSTLF